MDVQILIFRFFKIDNRAGLVGLKVDLGGSRVL
jgi:hypothetical protein